MKLFVKELPLPADVPALARRLAGAPGLAVLASGGPPRGPERGAGASSFLLADPDAVCHELTPPAEAPLPSWAGRGGAPRWVGYIPYEAVRALERRGPDRRAPARIARPTWLRYPAALRIDAASGRVVVEADDAAAAAVLLRRLEAPPEAGAVRLRRLEDAASEERHGAAVAEVLRLIARGDVYQVNLTRRLRYRVEGDPLALFLALHRRSPAPYGFFLAAPDGTVVGASPELALAVRGRALVTAPIKGTRPRGEDAEADAALARELDDSEKERAELVMAVDLHRNDLGRVAVLGSVRVPAPPRLVPSATVWSREAEVRAVLADGLGLREILAAVVPCGSVTGAPKGRAMEVIAELEAERRGLYTGVYGFVGRDGDATFAVAIRTLEVAPGGDAEYGTGGGIVWGSDPAREVEETRWKAAALTALAAAGGELGEPTALLSPGSCPT